MIVCKNCGEENLDDSLFCQSCGERLTTPQRSNSDLDDKYSYENVRLGSTTKDMYSSVFVDSDEKTICTLGSGYPTNMVSGTIKSVAAVLSQRRVYLSGAALTKNGKEWEKLSESKIVDIQDIRATGFTYTSRVVNLIIGILMILFGISTIIVGANLHDAWKAILISGGVGLIVIGIIFFIKFFMSRKTIFRIEYAGGQIGFDVKWLSSSQSENFQKQIHLVKQKYISDQKA